MPGLQDYHQLTRPPSPATRWLYRSALLAALAASALGVYDWQHGKLTAPQVAFHAATPAAAPAAPASDPQADRQAAAVLATLQGDWPAILRTIEQASGPDVTLLEVHPDLAKGHIELAGEARSFKALSEYIKRLNQAGVVRNATLLHEEALSHDNVETVGFKLEGET